ncbi:MAG: aminotransferase class V-fold PLP-dependent enzyme, partial [Syntrophothermus sp.]
ILADNVEDRLGAISFYVTNIHYNLIVKILNDKYGIQVRGGCSCAGTYGHYLLHVDRNKSALITEKINHGDLSEKPGWVRMSLHPTMTNAELEFIVKALKETVSNIKDWEKDYTYIPSKNEFIHKNSNGREKDIIKSWFSLN